jgi:hypothetical protein
VCIAQPNKELTPNQDMRSCIYHNQITTRYEEHKNLKQAEIYHFDVIIVQFISTLTETDIC